MKNWKEIAEFYYLGLEFGFVTQLEVIAWADQIILDSDVPDNRIIDISLSGKHIWATKDALRPLFDDFSSQEIQRRVLVEFKNQLALKPQKAFMIASRFRDFADRYGFTPKNRELAASIEIALWIVEDKIDAGQEQEATRFLDDLLNKCLE